MIHATAAMTAIIMITIHHPLPAPIPSFHCPSCIIPRFFDLSMISDNVSYQSRMTLMSPAAHLRLFGMASTGGHR